jgi:uncharacterized protein (DUF433 family)
VAQTRKERKTEPFSIRLSPATDAIVSDEARRSGRSRGAIVEELALEAAKMRLFPGIGFRGRPRRAWVIGTGLDVWEIVAVAESFNGQVEKILQNYPLLTARALRVARSYAERFPNEIEDFIEPTRRPLDELRRLYPFLHFED